MDEREKVITLSFNREELGIIQFAIVSTDELWKKAEDSIAPNAYVPKDEIVQKILDKIQEGLDKIEKERWHLVDYVKTRDGVFRVSTIFLGPDYDMPYETMVFAEEGITLSEKPMWRYKTKEEAEDNHQKIVRRRHK